MNKDLQDQPVLQDLKANLERKEHLEYQES
jgi:hypothetical protein